MTIKITTEYITLGQLLKLLGIAHTGGAAKIFLQDALILVDNEPENRRGRKLYPGFKVEINGSGYLIEASCENN